MGNEVDSDILAPHVVNPHEAIKSAEQDMNFLALLCLFDVMQFKFPDMYLAMWELLRSKVHLVRDFSKIALGIPRGFAKTTLVKLFIVFCILLQERNLF